MAIDKSMNVLIVDDFVAMLRTLRRMLNLVGFNNVNEVTNGVEALSMLRDRKVGLVISDWDMSPMTGLQLLQEVRSDPRLKSLPFILTTGASTVDKVVNATQAGASGFLGKPFNVETLRLTIERCCRT